MSVGRRIGLPEASRAAQSSIRSSSTSEPPTSWPAAARKVKAMPPPTIRSVDPVAAAPRARRACRPPWPRRPRRRTAGPAPRAARPVPRSPAGGGSRPHWAAGLGGPTTEAWRPVGDAEGVVDVGVVPVDQLLDERRVVLLLARVEAEVLEQLDLGGQPGQLLADRAQVPADVRGAAGPAEVGAGGDLGAVLEQVVQGGQGRPDAEVVGDRRTARPAQGRSGTLKSTRTSTLAPSRSGRSPSSGSPSSSGLSDCSVIARHPPRSLPHPTRCSHEPGLPTTSERSTSRLAYPHSLSYQPCHLDQGDPRGGGHHHGQPGVEGARCRAADDVRRDDGVLGVDEDLGQRARRCGLGEGRVDLGPR